MELEPALRPDLFAQLVSGDPYQGRARRLFERGLVVAVEGNQADLRVGMDAQGNPLELRGVPIVSGYLPQVGDWVAVQYEAGRAAAPWVAGPCMAGDAEADSAGIGVFPISSQEPADPAQSLVYFDLTQQTWRGWDGEAWVNLPTRLHNQLGGLQGGTASEYYHFDQTEHDALQDFCDGSGMAVGYLRKLVFRAADASDTSRARMFEKDGDWYLAVNAEYHPGSDTWNRIDPSKYAYLMEFRSQNAFPGEVVSGIAWYRAVPGSNPIGAWGTFGGWEAGWWMTQDRNAILGGNHLEMDGYGDPPYGRLLQIASDEPQVSGGLTGLQRNSWYDGEGLWNRDTDSKASAVVGLDANGDLFVWWYPASAEGEAPWGTSAWQRRAWLHMSGSVRGRLDVVRASSESALASAAFLAKHRTSADMGDGFGAGYAFALEDSAGVENVVAAVYGLRAGADNTGDLLIQLASAGSMVNRLLVGHNKVTIYTASGYITMGPENTSWCHLQTDRASFYFNKSIAVSGGVIQAYNASMTLQAPHGTPRVTIDQTTGLATFANSVKVTSYLGLGADPDSSARMVAAGQYYSSRYDNGDSGASKTINWDNGNVQRLRLTANCTLTLSNPKSGGRYLLELVQDSTGGRTVTWPSTVKWPGGTAPTLSGANKVDIIALSWNGTVYFGGSNLNYTVS